MGKLILTIGIIGLCHAAYSATQHRNYLRLTDADKGVEEIVAGSSSSRITSLPLDIVVQTLVSLLLSCVGLIGISAKFRPIKITSEWENKTWDNVGNRSSFWSFQHRGKTLFTSPDSAETLTSEFQIQNKPPKPVSSNEELLKKAIALEKEQRRAAAAAAAAGASSRRDLEEQEEGEEEEGETGGSDGDQSGSDNNSQSGDDSQNLNNSHN